MILNTIITLLFISQLFQFLSNKKTTVLYCGLFGFIGDTKNFSWNKFHILGIVNDSRGGDAVGISCDRDVYHYNKDDVKRYLNMTSKMMNPKVGNSRVILGHTRKTSYNALNTNHLEYTQPYKIYDEDKTLIGIGIHNGTLYNHEELAAKFNLPESVFYKDEKGNFSKHKPNDSQVLLHYLVTSGDTKILEEYQGSAALVWHDFRNNKTMVYRGESPISKVSTVSSEERPLYILAEKNNIWFSSIENPLWTISRNNLPNIYEIKENTVFCVEGNSLKNVSSINRKFGQYKISENNNYTVKSSWGREDWYLRDRPGYLFEDEEYDNKYDSNPLYESILGSGYKISFYNGRYYYENKLLDGIYNISEYGYIKETNSAITPRKEYYFKNGVMLKGVQEYIRCSNLYNEKEHEIYGTKEISLLSSMSYLPVTSGDGKDTSKTLYFIKNNGMLNLFSGIIQPIFSHKIYKIKNGILQEIKNTSFSSGNHSLNEEIKKDVKVITEKADSLSLNDDVNDEDLEKLKTERLNSDIKSSLISIIDEVNKQESDLMALYKNDEKIENVKLVLNYVAEYLGDLDPDYDFNEKLY